MSYTRLISRPGYGATGAWYDPIKGAASNVLDFYGAQQRTQGANDVLAAQQAAERQAAGGGGTPGWLLPVLLGGGALVALLVLKKRKSS